MPMDFDPLLRFLHVAGVTVWVGGMFFAYMCLRPSAAELLAPPLRLPLWQRVFQRFFVWVWVAVILIPVSGLGILLRVGFAGAPVHWHLMLASGFLMIGIFLYVVTGPYARLRTAVVAQDWPAAGAALNRIRQAVGSNLLLGLATIGLATLGRFLA